MLTEIYIETLLVNEELADQVWVRWFAKKIDDLTAWAEPPGELLVRDVLTIEAWVLWEGGRHEEIAAATGIDIGKGGILCGQRAHGFLRNAYGATASTSALTPVWQQISGSTMDHLAV